MTYVEEFCEEIALINQGEIVLTGNLKDIKTEYGMNRLIISDVELSSKELEKTFIDKLENIARVVEIRNDYLIIELVYDQKKNNLLKTLIDLNLDIEKFATYEPTLTDIFVQRVGESK